MTNSDWSMAMPMATMERPADRGWFLRVTKTISTNASSGRSRMVNAVLTTLFLPLHQIELVYLYGAALAVDGDDDGQSDGRFSGSLGDDEDGEHLAGELLFGGQVARKGNHQQVHAVEHQLDAEQDADGVAARQH